MGDDFASTAPDWGSVNFEHALNAKEGNHGLSIGEEAFEELELADNALLQQQTFSGSSLFQSEISEKRASLSSRLDAKKNSLLKIEIGSEMPTTRKKVNSDRSTGPNEQQLLFFCPPPLTSRSFEQERKGKEILEKMYSRKKQVNGAVSLTIQATEATAAMTPLQMWLEDEENFLSITAKSNSSSSSQSPKSPAFFGRTRSGSITPRGGGGNIVISSSGMNSANANKNRSASPTASPGRRKSVTGLDSLIAATPATVNSEMEEAEKFTFKSSYNTGSSSRIHSEKKSRMLEILSVPGKKRSRNDLQFLQKATKQVKYFQREEVKAHHLALCSVLEHLHLEKDKVLYEQGSIGSTFYIILDGCVDVQIRTSDDPNDHSVMTVATLYKGDAFGELAILGNGKRTASVITRDDCDFIILNEEDYLSTISEARSIQLFLLLEKPPNERTESDLDQLVEMTYGLKFFNQFSTAEKRIICKYITHQRVREGAMVYRKGDFGDQFYIIKEGGVEVFMNLPGLPSMVKIHSLHAGASFGELALLTDGVREATIRATKETQFIVMKQPHYDNLIRDRHMFEFEEKVIGMTLSLPIVRHLDPLTIKQMTTYLDLVTYSHGRTIVAEGEPLDSIYFVTRGDCHITIHGEFKLTNIKILSENWPQHIATPRREGITKSLEFATACPGESIGELYLWSGCDSWPVSVIAASEVEVIKINVRHFSDKFFPKTLGSMQRIAIKKASTHENQLEAVVACQKKMGFVPIYGVSLPKLLSQFEALVEADTENSIKSAQSMLTTASKSKIGKAATAAVAWVGIKASDADWVQSVHGRNDGHHQSEECFFPPARRPKPHSPESAPPPPRTAALLWNNSLKVIPRDDKGVESLGASPPPKQPNTSLFVSPRARVARRRPATAPSVSANGQGGMLINGKWTLSDFKKHVDPRNSRELQQRLYSRDRKQDMAMTMNKEGRQLAVLLRQGYYGYNALIAS